MADAAADAVADAPPVAGAVDDDGEAGVDDFDGPRDDGDLTHPAAAADGDDVNDEKYFSEDDDDDYLPRQSGGTSAVSSASTGTSSHHERDEESQKDGVGDDCDCGDDDDDDADATAAGDAPPAAPAPGEDRPQRRPTRSSSSSSIVIGITDANASSVLDGDDHHDDNNGSRGPDGGATPDLRKGEAPDADLSDVSVSSVSGLSCAATKTAAMAPHDAATQPPTSSPSSLSATNIIHGGEERRRSTEEEAGGREEVEKANADTDGDSGRRRDDVAGDECSAVASSAEGEGLNSEDDFDADAVADAGMVGRWGRPASTSAATFADRHHPATSRFRSLHDIYQHRRDRSQHQHHRQQQRGCRPLFTIVIPTAPPPAQAADADVTGTGTRPADLEAEPPPSQSPARKGTAEGSGGLHRDLLPRHHPECHYETDEVSDYGSDDFHGDGDHHREESSSSPTKDREREKDKDGGFHSEPNGGRFGSNGNLATSVVSSILTADGAGADGTIAAGGDRHGQGQDRDDERGDDLEDPDDDPYAASPDSKYYPRYAVRVNRHQNDRSGEIALYSLARPHMRAFHSSWIGFFVAFFVWFAITPLLSEVQISLHLTKEQIWTSSIAGTAGTIVMRAVMGPLCDKYGARTCMSAVLIASAVPAALTGLVRTSAGLSVLRLFVGVAGGAFVACQYWTSVMFVREAAGTANALASGWGNLGGGVAQIVMGSAVFPLLKAAYGGSSDRAWRTACVVPAILSVLTAVVIFGRSDDCPKGNYRKMTRRGSMVPVSATASLASAARQSDAWILALQYGCCFGVEVTMNNAAALYFKEEFGQTTEAAAAIASVFGWMNLFARGLGGFGSDMSNYKHGTRGRLGWQFVNLLLEGITILVFGSAGSLGVAIFVMILFSVFVQSAEGSTYGIVPSVHPRFTGGVVGIVAAGGNVGGVVFAIVFREFDYRHAFYIMGVAVIFSSLFSFFVKLGGGGGAAAAGGGGAGRPCCCLCCPLGSSSAVPRSGASRQEPICGEEAVSAQRGNFVSQVVESPVVPG